MHDQFLKNGYGDIHMSEFKNILFEKQGAIAHTEG
jgi:hypothetical protein